MKKLLLFACIANACNTAYADKVVVDDKGKVELRLTDVKSGTSSFGSGLLGLGGLDSTDTFQGRQLVLNDRIRAIGQRMVMVSEAAINWAFARMAEYQAESKRLKLIKEKADLRWYLKDEYKKRKLTPLEKSNIIMEKNLVAKEKRLKLLEKMYKLKALEKKIRNMKNK